MKDELQAEAAELKFQADIFKSRLLGTAEWRRQTGEKFDDPRNGVAADILDKLAEDTHDFGPNAMRFYFLCANPIRNALRDTEDEAQYLREIGFSRFPKSFEIMAAELLRLIDEDSESQEAA